MAGVVTWLAVAACTPRVPPTRVEAETVETVAVLPPLEVPPSAPVEVVEAAAPAPPPPPSFAAEAATIVRGLTLEEKVGQLMMVGFAGTAVDDDIAELVRGKRVGGVCLFRRNITGAAQTATLNDDVRELLVGGIPPFIAVDQEGGNVVRLSDGNVVLPGNMALGATRDVALAYTAGKAQGLDLWRLGFNMNLAPVLDVNTNPANPVIGVRAFGDDPTVVAALGASFIRGQQAAQIVTVAKHFPGHGAVDADSHTALPVLRVTHEEMRAQLKPFSDAMAEGLDGVMTAHVATPLLSDDGLPATLSPAVLGGLLRTELGFDGLVLTDELEMDAIGGRYGVGRAAVRAIAAGADMVLVPWRAEKKTEVWESLLHAVNTETLPMATVDAAVRRIVTAKLRRGLYAPLPPRAERLAQVGSERVAASTIAAAAVTLFRSSPSVLPLKKGRVVVVSADGSLPNALRQHTPVVSLVVPAFPRAGAATALRQKVAEVTKGADVVVLGIINRRQLELLEAIDPAQPVVVVLMGLPYLADRVGRAQAVLLTYSYRAEAAEAVANTLFGLAGAPGVLPVVLPASKGSTRPGKTP
ncbi:MAG: beta-N-acetylhexosaminidase [Archangium sp.]|nr:beta-N-acetylhexosaminidase [Archangium sp.]